MSKELVDGFYDYMIEAMELGIPVGIQAWNYARMRADGQSTKLAEMLATKSFPGVHGTSSTFMQGTHAQDSNMDRYRYTEAAKAGVDTNGKRYLSSLARFPNDPEAWVSGPSDVSRIVSDRNWNCRGLVEHKAHETEPDADVPIAADIVNHHVNACLRAFPTGDHTAQLKADITEQVTKELSGEVDLTPEPGVSDYEYDDAVRVSEE